MLLFSSFFFTSLFFYSYYTSRIPLRSREPDFDLVMFNYPGLHYYIVLIVLYGLL